MPPALETDGRRRSQATMKAVSAHAIVRLSAIILPLCSLVLLGACTPTATSVAVSPTRMVTSPTARRAEPSPLETPAATLSRAPVSTATPAPTLDPDQVADITETIENELASREIDPLCLRWEDADDDEAPEWVGLYLRPADPPRLEGFVLDGDIWHELRVPQEGESGLGTYPTCELDVRDVNADGRTELLIRGHTAGDVDLLHIFVWREARYNLLASFAGNAGIEVANTDGSLEKEIIARWDAGDGLAWEQVHTWDGTHYGWTWERYTWLYADHPHVYLTDTPEHAVISFYLALGDRNLPRAYRLFSSAARDSQAYQTWAAGFNTMLSAEAGSVHEIGRADDTATVTAQVRSYDNLDGYVVGRLWDVTWTLVRGDGAWQLQHGANEQLDRWEAVYFP